MINQFYVGQDNTFFRDGGYGGYGGVGVGGGGVGGDGYSGDDESSLFVDCFDDYNPVEGKEYFDRKIESRENACILIAGMVFYNEDVTEVKRTLKSLGEQISSVRDICKTQVIIVGDGISQMHQTTSDYLFNLFCKNQEDNEVWESMIDDLNNGENRTCIIQRCTRVTKSLCCIKIDEFQYPMTLILKSENRRKHNSQEWILNSFATQAFTNTSTHNHNHNNNHNHFVFMTDCGTLFEENCLKRLMQYIIKHPKCAGATARQRVMTAKEQDLKDESIFSVAKFLRIIQLADYEVSYATYTGAFSAVGALPVLPGPCALFRYSSLTYTDDIEGGKECGLRHYNNLVNTSINDTNICIENVKLAEDRIPSYSVITHGPPGAYTTWVDGAIFKFQAETTLEKLILQRRRWINGALSCYVWNGIINPKLILNSRHNIFRKLVILLLFWLQIFTYIFAMCTYGVLSGSLYISLLSLFHIDSKISLLVTFIYGFIVLNHLIVHKFYVYSWVLTSVTVLANSIVLGFVVSGFINEIVKWGGLSHDDLGRTMIIYSAIVIVCIPFVMAVLSLNLKSVIYLILSFIPYWLFLPTLVGTFVMYSIARLSDITWGNRVSLQKSSFNGASDLEISNLQNRMNIISGFVLLAVIVLNVGVTSVMILFYTNSLFIGILMVTIVGVFVIQCAISVVYFVIKHLSCQTCKQRISL